MASVATLSIAVNTQTRGLRRGLSQAQQQVRGFRGSARGIGKGMAASFFKAQVAAQLFMGALRRVGAAFQAINPASLQNLKDAFSTLDNVAKVSDKLGVSTEALSGLQFGADVSGVKGFDTALQRMVRRTAEAAQGTGEAKAAIKELGLDARTLAAMRPEDQLGAIADAMAQVPSQSDRVRLAFKLFDTEGVGMVNLLRNGSAGLEEFKKRAGELGIVFSRVDLAKIEQANDAITELKTAFKGLAMGFAVQIAPFVTALAQKLTDMTTGFLDGATGAERFIRGIRFVAEGIASTMDFIEKIGLAVAGSITGLGASLLFEFKAFIDGINATIEKLPEKVRDAFGLEPSDTSDLGRMIDSLDSSADSFQDRINDINLNPRSAGVSAFFDDVQRRSEENAAAVADSVAGGGMEIKDDIVSGFKEGLEALERGTSEEFSAVLNAMQGGVQGRAAREAVDRGGAAHIAAMGGEPIALGVAPGDLGRAAARLEREASGGESRPMETRSVLEVLQDIGRRIEESNRLLGEQTQLTPAAI